jgi:hypothetical protein
MSSIVANSSPFANSASSLLPLLCTTRRKHAFWVCNESTN